MKWRQLGAMVLLALASGFGSLVAAQTVPAAPLWVAPAPAAGAVARAVEQVRPWQFAVPLAAGLTADADGAWFAEGEERVWRLTVHSAGAESLSFHFDSWQVPPGAALWIRDADSDQRQGPYGTRYNPAGELWTALIVGDTAHLELRVPHEADAPRLRLARVMHGFRSTDAGLGFTHKAGNCNIDVACPEADPFREQVRSTVLLQFDGLQFNGSGACTGTLVNNTANDQRPYVLTAHHCGIRANNAASVVAYFNFERSACERGAQSNRENVSLDPQQSLSGAVLRATNARSDFTLLEMGDVNQPAEIPPGWNPFWSGWTRDTTPADAGASIHHPSGDEKSIALFTTPLTSLQVCSCAFNRNPCVSDVEDVDNCPAAEVADVWKVTWSSGTTEGGSSGSGLYATADALHRGQLFGGGASCFRPGEPDFYGRFDVSWAHSAAANAQLAAWLDPRNVDPVNWPGVGVNATPVPTSTPLPTAVPSPTASPSSTPQPSPPPTAEPSLPPSDGGSSGATGYGLLLGLVLLGWWRARHAARRRPRGCH
ncbi:MAG: hypothetical protein ABF296_12930 [Oceanococcaceae bacterium]